MKQAYKTQGLRLQARMTAALLAAAGFCSGAWAENKLAIEPVNIQPGGTATVVVNLENEDNLMSALQMDIVVPNGITLDDQSVAFTGDRVDENDFYLYARKQDNTQGGNVYRILVVPNSLINFEGNSGALLQFSLKATNSLTKAQDIEIKGIVGSGVDGTKYEMNALKVRVSPLVGTVTATSAGADSLIVRPAVEGDRQRVSVALDNSVEVRVLEAVITLPEGLDFDLNKQGGVLIERGTRVPTNLKFSSNITASGKAKVVLSGLTADALKGESGEVFAFYVKGTEALAERSELTVSDVVVADNAGNGFEIYDEQKVKVVNMDKVYLQPAQAIVAALNDSLAKAMLDIETNCASVKDSAVVTEAKKAIDAQISALSKAIEAAYTDGTLASDYNNKVAPKADIEAAITAMIEAAQKAQKDFEAGQALNAAYAQAQEALTALNDTLAKAMLDIETSCPDVKDSTVVTEAKATIDAQIATLSEAVEAAKADSTLTASIETILAPKADIEAAITAMIEAAKKAQHDFETGQALNAAYAQAQEALTALNDTLAKAMLDIETNCASVKDSAVVTEAKKAIDAQISALSKAIEAAYTDGTLASDYNNKVAPKADIEAAITAMIEAAQKAQKDFEAGQALNAAYAQAQEVLTALNDTLAKAMLDIEANCPDVKDSTVVTEAKAAIDAQITALSEAVEAAKADSTLTANIETILAPKADIEAAVGAMIEAAKKAQKDFETGQALNAAYAQAQEVLTALNDTLAKAMLDIETNCADVKDSTLVTEAKTAIEAQIAALNEAVEAAKADSTLTVNIETILAPKADIEAAITAMIEAAQKAQKDFETEQDLNAAYAQAQEVLTALNDTLAKAMLDIEANCPDVKDSTVVTEAKATIDAQIAALSEAVEAAKADSTLTANIETILAPKADIEAAVGAMIEAAQKAQKDFETGQALNAAYAQAQELLTQLNADFAQAVEDINTNCPDVKDSDDVLAAQTAVKEQLDAAAKAVDEAKADGSLIDKKDELLAKKADIEAAITKMTEDAQKAQKDFEAEQALNAAYAQAQELLTQLNATFTKAVEDINANCPDVKDSEAVLDAQTGVKEQLDAAAKAVDEAKADGSLIDKKDELLAKKAEIEAAITKMTEDAQKAQKDFETEQALNAAYAQAQEVLSALNQKLENAIEAIGTFCPDVKDSTLVTEAKAAIEAQIAALNEAVEAAKADGSLTANIETILAPKADIEADIAKMVEDARKAQHDIDTGIDTAYGQEEIDAVFTLAGVRIPHIIKGQTCIIRYKNGSTKKIMVK